MRRERRGFMLVELLLVISGMLIIFGLCVALLHGLLKLDRVARDHLAESVSRDRLARRFRLDVRAASRAKPTTGEATSSDRLELEFPDGRVIDYRALEGRIVRAERNREGEDMSRESYRLPSRARPRFEVHRQEQASFVKLRLQREPAPGGPQTRHDPGYEARLGKDLRFVDPQEAAL